MDAHVFILIDHVLCSFVSLVSSLLFLSRLSCLSRLSRLSRLSCFSGHLSLFSSLVSLVSSISLSCLSYTSLSPFSRFPPQLRRQMRERREYLFRKSQETQEKTTADKKRRLKDALDGKEGIENHLKPPTVQPSLGICSPFPICPRSRKGHSDRPPRRGRCAAEAYAV